MAKEVSTDEMKKAISSKFMANRGKKKGKKKAARPY